MREWTHQRVNAKEDRDGNQKLRRAENEPRSKVPPLLQGAVLLQTQRVCGTQVSQWSQKHIHVYVYIYIHTCVYIYMYMCIYIYTCIYIYMYTFRYLHIEL